MRGPMNRRVSSGKLYHLFTLAGASLLVPARSRAEGWAMVGLALAMFIAVFGWGGGYFGWHDPDGKVQLALATTFILGAVCGYKSRS